MKICHLMYDDIANPWLGGGGAVRAMELYRRLASRHEITVVSGLFPGAEPETERHGLRLLRVGSARSYALSRVGYCRAAVAQLQRLEWDLWINEFSAFAPLRVPAALRRQGLLLFYHFMGWHALAKHPLVGGVAWLCERRALRAYGRILTIAPSVQARIQRRARDAEVDLVYSGVDRRFFALVPEEAPYLLYFGRMDIHTKGIDLLIAAFAEIAAEYPEIRLKLAGRGTPKQLANVHSLARRAGLEGRVEIIGNVERNDKASFCAAPSWSAFRRATRVGAWWRWKPRLLVKLCWVRTLTACAMPCATTRLGCWCRRRMWGLWRRGCGR